MKIAHDAPAAAGATDIAVPHDPKPRWRTTLALIGSDFQRLETLIGGGSFMRRLFIFMLPSYQALFQYRLYHHLHRHGWRATAQLMYLASQWWTRVDIPPRTVIGAACLLGHPPIVLCGRFGDRFTFMGFSTIGGGMDGGDIGAGPGLPVVGDDVSVAVKASVLGPVRIGNGCRIGPGAVVTTDLAPDSLVLWERPRVLRGAASRAAGAAAAPETPA